MAPIDALVDEFKRCAYTRNDWMNFRSHREHQDPVTVAAMSPKHLASRSGQALSLGMGAL